MTGHIKITDPVELIRAQVKLRGSLDGKMATWWIRATQFAVVDTILTPLYNIQNASFQKFAKHADDHYGISMLELAYFTDLETGEPLSQFRNPFTGDVGEVPPGLFGPNQVSLTRSGLQPPEFFPFGTLTFDGELGPGYSDGEDTWIREETLVRMTSGDPAFGDYIYNELVTYRGRAAEVDDPEIACADAAITYSTTSNWRPWMMAGDTPGHIMTEGFGKKVAGVDELPSEYLALAAKLHPEVLANPAGYFEVG